MGTEAAVEADAPASARRTGRRRRWPWIVTAVAVAYAGAVSFLLLSAKGDLQHGRDQIDTAKDHAGAGELADAEPLPYLRSATAAFGRAHRKVSNPVVSPLKAMPFIGRQLRSVDKLSGAAHDVAAVGADGVRQAKALLDGEHGPGARRLDFVRLLRDLAARTDGRLAAIDLGPRVGLLPPLRDAYNQFSTQLFDLRTTLQKATAASEAANALLTGPRRYLLIAANNAEMRAGAGTFLSVGVLEAGDGRVAIGDMQSTADVGPPDGKAPPIDDADLAARWAWKVPNTDYRQLMLSPRFPASAELATKMWEASGRPPVDGVLVLDPVALQAVIAATGPVKVGDLQVDADNVVDELLRRQYERFGDDEAVQASRREQLGNIARAAFDAVDRGDVSISTLATGLADAVAGRHLFAWATRPVEQRGWEAAGLAGTLQPDSILVAVNNRGCNKMDRFLDVRSDIDLQAAPGGGTDGRMVVRVRNTTPADEPAYVKGPYCPNGLKAGEYPGILAVSLPSGTSGVTVDGTDRFNVIGPDGPNTVAGVGFTLALGAERTFDLRFHVAGDRRSFRIEPGARVPATLWRFRQTTWRDVSARIVRF